MSRHVNAIAGRLSLRPPQRRSLEILDRITEIAPPRKQVDLRAVLDVIRSEFPTVTDFEREFPSVCFALATGVGKTRLMGAFISYLHLEHGLNNFFVLAPNLTIYNKLITDFTPNTPKYVFRGIAEFATSPPNLVTGEDYETAASVRGLHLIRSANVNIFNISKINSEVRGGRSPRIKRLSEYIGESYFDYLAALPDLVLIMDESHRYRASAGVRALNELKPVLGLELTATPFVGTGNTAETFRNVIFDYPLARAMEDGFVKEPAVVTRKDFNPAGMSDAEVERIKLEDGIRLHEVVKVELETYARDNGEKLVKPFLLVIARDTTHAGELMKLIQSDKFFDGHYASKVIQVDSSRTGAEEDEMVSRLLRVEDAAEPTEIVIHVNMLKEGWDVTNLYTIVPLRAANARVLVEQSIGRGLRLPYGRRTGVMDVDRLNIVAHDRFQEIVDDANRPDSPVRLQQIVLDPEKLKAKIETVVAASVLEHRLGLAALPPGAVQGAQVHGEKPLFITPEERQVARATFDVVWDIGRRPDVAPVLGALSTPSVRSRIVEEVERRLAPAQLEIDGTRAAPDVAAIVEKTVAEIERLWIGIPRISVGPREGTRWTFTSFELDLSGMRYQPVSDELWIQHIRTHQLETRSTSGNAAKMERAEDYVVTELMDFDEISYDQQSELLYSLASQVVRHLGSYLPAEQVPKVMRCYAREIARAVYAQMKDRFREEAGEQLVVVSRGFTKLEGSAYTKEGDVLDFRIAPDDKTNMGRYLFEGFTRCPFTPLKFQSDPERRLAVILDRAAMKWLRPAERQFQIYYNDGIEQRTYTPDFVAETEDSILMIEVKARGEIEDRVVQAKRVAAETWCRHASEHAARHGAKPWRYALIPHDVIADNMTLRVLTAK